MSKTQDSLMMTTAAAALGGLPESACSDSQPAHELNREQWAILEHTNNRAAGGRYCGGSKDMDGLVDMGLMQFLGKPTWCDDKFYGITSVGRSALRNRNGKSSASAER